MFMIRSRTRAQSSDHNCNIMLGQANPPYNGLAASIERVPEVAPADRIGPRLRAQGIERVADIDGRHMLVVDVSSGMPGEQATDSSAPWLSPVTQRLSAAAKSPSRSSVPRVSLSFASVSVGLRYEPSSTGLR
jgi:hypothetical protein